MKEKKYSGNTGMPIKYPRASAQRQRQTDSQQYDSYIDDENPDAWKVEKTPNSAVRLNYPRQGDNYPGRKAPKDEYKTQLMKQRRLDRTSLVMLLCIVVIVMIGGWWLFSTIAN